MTAEEYKAARAELEWTQQQLAGALELNVNTVARRERGELPIPREAEMAIEHLSCKKRKKG